MKFLIRLPLVFLALWGLLHGLGKVVRLSPEWPLWAVAAVAAIAVEAVLFLYRYESGAVTPRRARWLTGLRLGALGVLVWILVEPVWVRMVRLRQIWRWLKNLSLLWCERLGHTCCAMIPVQRPPWNELKA